MIVFLPWLVDLLFELETVLLEKVKINHKILFSFSEI